MQPDLENLKNKVAANRDLIDRITAKLPGFSGYVEKSEMYSADSVIREFMVDRIKRFKSDVSTLSSDFFRDGKTNLLPDVDSLSLNLEKVMNMVRYADYGSSGSLSKVKVTEEDMNRLLEYDWRLISRLDETEKLIEDLTKGEGETGAKLKELREDLRDFERAFEDRKNVLLEVL